MPYGTLLGGWVAAGLTLFMYSFLYRDNPFFKFGEHLYIGVSMGYTIVRVFYDTMMRDLYVPVVSEGKVQFLLPALLGLLMLARFLPQIGWVSRWSFAFIVGFGAGVAIPRTISAYLLQQVEGTVRPLVSMEEGGGASLVTLKNLNTFLLLIGVVSVLFYFFFSVEHKGPIRIFARVGIYFLMISFGAGFGYTVMARLSLLIGRFDDLISFAGREFGYATPLLLVMTVGGLLLWERRFGTEERHGL